MSIFLSTAKKILIHSENIMNINIHSHYESKVNINTVYIDWKKAIIESSAGK